MGGMRPLGPSRGPRPGGGHMVRWIIVRNRPLDWEKTFYYFASSRFRAPMATVEWAKAPPALSAAATKIASAIS